MINLPSPTKKRKRRSSGTHEQILRKKILAKNSMIHRLKKNRVPTTRKELNLLGVKSKSVRIFINMQLYHKAGHPWTKDEQQLALNMYHKSPALYLFLREQLKFVLPSKSTIEAWLRLAHLTTGTNTELFKKLRFKVESMLESEKQCVLLFDEMSLKKGVEYNARQDIVEGFEDLGHLSRSGNFATHALVFMVRGLLQNWKIPVSYYLIGGSVKHQPLTELLLKNIQALQGIGLKVRVVTCDQAAAPQTEQPIQC